jgi:DNA-binding SARP family transcriptional activator
MGLLQRQGRRSEALKIYRDLEKNLQAELDTVPDSATTRLYEEICELKAESSFLEGRKPADL